MSATRTYWPVPRLWPGETAFVIGGGPSLRGFDFDRLRDRNVVAVNAAFIDAPRASVMLSSAHAFYEMHRDAIAAFGGIALTMSKAAHIASQGRLHLIEAIPTLKEGFAVPAGAVRRGLTTGHTAAALAVAMGASRVVLLGIDGRAGDDGASHFHGHYTHRGPTTADQLAAYVAAWKGWRADAEAVGVEIVNATPGSVVTEFTAVDIDDELADAAAPVATDLPDEVIPCETSRPPSRPRAPRRTSPSSRSVTPASTS